MDLILVTQALADILDEIDALMAENRRRRGPKREGRLQNLRRQAGKIRIQASRTSRPPVTSAPDLFSACSGLPEISPEDLNAKTLASGLLNYGALVVRGLYNPEQVKHLLQLASHKPDPMTQSGFVSASSSEVFELLNIFEDCGMLNAARDYLGNELVMIEERLTLKKRVGATEQRSSGLPWHQDVNFYGQKSYALNCWAAVTPCGIDNPGLAILPRRNEASIGWDKAEKAPITYGNNIPKELILDLRNETPEVLINFRPGDAIFFDEMTLHRSTIKPYKIPEQIVTIAWMFRASMFPDEGTPLAA